MPLKISGAEAAAMMLRDNGITNVRITSINGTLTDHYNPTDYTINLSTDVFSGRNVAAVAVAAHETGHAVQHAVGYKALKLRTALVPLQNVASNVLNAVFIAMLVLSFIIANFWPMALGIIVACYAIFTLFSFITLGVEIDASKRAIAWVTDKGVVNAETRPAAIDALRNAAYTYLVAALSSLATLLYYLLQFMSSDRD